MKKTILTMMITLLMVLSVSITSFAAGSIVGAIGMPNASAENASVQLTNNVENKYDASVQAVVDAINDAEVTKTIWDVVKTLTMDDVEVFEGDVVNDPSVDVGIYKFLSPIMDMNVTGVGNGPSMANPVDVTFVVNNMTKNISVDVLHYCAEHGWEILTGEKISANEVKASFHSLSPIAIVYRENQVSGGGSGSAPWFGPTATPIPERDTTTVQPGTATKPVEEPVATEEPAEVEPTEAPVVDSSEAPEVEPEATPTAEPDVPATAPATGSGITIPVIIIAVVLVGLGIFFIIFLKKKKNEEA